MRPGDRGAGAARGHESTVARIVTFDGDLDEAVAGQSVTLVLADEIDVSRGDVLSSVGDAAQVADQFEAHIVWMHEKPMLPGRPYLMKHRAPAGRGHRGPAQVQDQRQHPRAARREVVELNEIGVCNSASKGRSPSIPTATTGRWAASSSSTGSPTTRSAAGLLRFALRRSANISWQAIEVDKRAHAALKGQQPCVVWFTGLSGAGKSTIANLVEKRLHAAGRHTYLLDGDNVRHGLNRDLGFTEIDRIENIRRVAEVSKLMVDAGLIVLASFISPYAADRAMARNLLGPNEFCEVFVDTPLDVAEQQRPQGPVRQGPARRAAELHRHRLALRGARDPELRIDTTATSAQEAAEQVIATLQRMGVID